MSHKKLLHIFYSLIIFTCTHSLFSMQQAPYILGDDKNMHLTIDESARDPNQQRLSDTQYRETLFAELNQLINKKTGDNKYFGFIQAPLTEELMISILNLAGSERYKFVFDDPALHQELLNKNAAFRSAVQHFHELASTNIKKVDYKTLDIVKNPNKKQAFGPLNLLSPSIKKYFMDTALEKKSSSYAITAQSKSGGIKSYSLHPVLHLLAIATFGSKIELWDLQKSDFICSQIMSDVKDLRFSSDSSVLAAVSPDLLAILDAKTLKIICSEKITNPVSHIDFINNNIILGTDVESSSGPIYAWTYENKNFRFNGFTNNLFCSLGRGSFFKPAPTYLTICTSGNYTLPTAAQDSSLRIEKNGGINLFLCLQSFTNTSAHDRQKIKDSETFKGLTEYEQKLVLTSKV